MERLAPRRARILLGALCAAVVAAPAPARAQIDQPSWGIGVGFAPLWKVPETLGDVFGASTLDIQGREFRVGLIRGTTLGGEWGIVLVHKRFLSESVIEVEQSNGVISAVTDDAEMLGVEVYRFFPFARVGRTQIGVNLGGGLAQLRGFVTGSVRGRTASSIRAPISLSELLELAGRDFDIFPLGRAELGVAVGVNDRVKIRVGGGFTMPGIEFASISASWLLGEDR
jgi:hypothetical protein